MTILDENIGLSQREILQSWRIHFRAIGVEIGRFGMKDHDDIIPLLHSLYRPTFFTLDNDFYKHYLRHKEYCLVFLDAGQDDGADFIRRFLRHPEFRTRAKRMGKVVRVHHSGLSFWQIGESREQGFAW